MSPAARFSPAIQRALAGYYTCMLAHYGPTHWWPGDTPFEIAVGAILTQNTAWTNVEKAIANLKQARLLDVHALLNAPEEALERALVPSGYFRLKARRLRRFCLHLQKHYDGDMARLAEQPLERLRPELLAVYGIGPETADDILLYACGKPVFVIDAYTRRIFGRHGLLKDRDVPYEELRAWFERHVAPDLQVYKEYHGLLVYIGKDFCRRVPKCAECPLAPLLKHGKPILP